MTQSNTGCTCTTCDCAITTCSDHKKKPRYLIKFPIGDWSDDGHGKCEWFIVKSNMPLQIVREAQFRLQDKFEYFRLLFKDLSPVTIILKWLNLLMEEEQGLKLSVAPEQDIPSMVFAGFDEKGRHVSNPDSEYFW
jgi:hypothetical protein